MALIKMEKRECDVCGSVRNVETYRFLISIAFVGDPATGEEQEISNEVKDLCPCCLKRAKKFQARGLTKPTGQA